MNRDPKEANEMSANANPAEVSGQAPKAVEDDNRWIALYVLCAGMLMIVLDITIVNVALPSIQDDLGFSQSNLAWVVNAYLVPFGGLLLLAGRLGDLLGQRRIFLVGSASSPRPRCSAGSRRARRC
jgi:MFS family permease